MKRIVCVVLACVLALVSVASAASWDAVATVVGGGASPDNTHTSAVRLPDGGVKDLTVVLGAGTSATFGVEVSVTGDNSVWLPYIVLDNGLVQTLPAAATARAWMVKGDFRGFNFVRGVYGTAQEDNTTVLFVGSN